MDTSNSSNSNPLATALRRARDSGAVDNPKIRYKGMRFTLAGDKSANPGAVYVKDANYTYLGKITPQGEIKVQLPIPYAQVMEKDIQALIDNPELALMEEGKLTNTCCCCGRQLTNPLSVELGIGPICRGYYFLPLDTAASPTIQEDIILEELDEDIDKLLASANPPRYAAPINFTDLSNLSNPTISEQLSAPLDPNPAFATATAYAIVDKDTGTIYQLDTEVERLHMDLFKPEHPDSDFTMVVLSGEYKKS
jgi:hypothetical protein